MIINLIFTAILSYFSGGYPMHFYHHQNTNFYADLSDLLLLTSIGLTNPDRELAAGLTKGTFLSDLMACTKGVAVGLKTPGTDSATTCSSCCCSDANCSAGCGDTALSTDSVLDVLTACADTCLHLDTEDIYHRLNREYNRLFISPRRELIPIYESILVHGKEKATMFINATCMHTEQTYRHNNFTFEEKNKVPGDHVAIELRYLAYLFAAYLNAVQASSEASCEAVEAAVEDFCGAHVQRWLGKFIDEIRANSKEPFYLLLAEVLEFVKPVLLN